MISVYAFELTFLKSEEVYSWKSNSTTIPLPWNDKVVTDKIGVKEMTLHIACL